MRREIASRMHERLSLIKIDPTRVLDAGCGLGEDIPVLQGRFPDARILGLDGSFPMLAAASEKDAVARSFMTRLMATFTPAKLRASSDFSKGLICGDFAQLPISANGVDLVWSNQSLHWHPQPDRVFAEWRRVLKVDGLLMFSCLGPDTFKELRSAFSNFGVASPFLPFVDMHDFGDMLVNAGFSTPVMDMETITVTYESVSKLMADVRAWGGNPLATRNRGLLGRQGWTQIGQALEQNRGSDARIPLTFEVVYGHAFRPAPTTTSSGEAIVKWDLPRKSS